MGMRIAGFRGRTRKLASALHDKVNRGGKKIPATAGIFLLYCLSVSGSSLDIGRLLAFRSLRDIEIHFLTFFESLEATHVDCGKVCEQIFAAIVGSDEAKAFGIIEPLNGTSCHKSVFQILTNHTSRKSKKLRATLPPLITCSLPIN